MCIKVSHKIDGMKGMAHRMEKSWLVNWENGENLFYADGVEVYENIYFIF